tara:strand:- start:36 stop:155 length:120 start_codon:yes stop_codon:yes gene_type:complete
MERLGRDLLLGIFIILYLGHNLQHQAQRHITLRLARLAV